MLLNRGFVQEVGVLNKVTDETQQDVVFILSGLRDPEDPDRPFLEAFYEEEFEADTALASTQKRRMTPRRKIRDRVARFFSEPPGSPVNRNRHSEMQRTIDKVQSGYVHGASGHIMEMYGGVPPRFGFQMNGIAGTSREQLCREEFWVYIYRSIFVFAVVASAFAGPAACRCPTSHDSGSS